MRDFGSDMLDKTPTCFSITVTILFQHDARLSPRGDDSPQLFRR